MSSPAFQFYPSDFISDENVQLMSLDEIGAYIILICFAWKEGSIPDDVEKISRLCKVSCERMDKLWLAIKPCFKIDKKNSKRLIHPRLEEERKKQKDFSKKRSKASKIRWEKEKSGDANALQMDSKSNALQSSSSSTTSSSKEVVVDPPTPLPQISDGAGTGIFFEIKRPDGVYSEKEWIRQQLIEHLRQSKKPFDRGASLETVLSFNHNLVGVYRRWLKIPIHRRMAVFVLVTLDKTLLSSQFTYALKVAENENPTPEQQKQLFGYLKRAQALTEQGSYEVEIDV